MESEFNKFVLLQAQSAGMFLGQIPNPVSGVKVVNLKAADSIIATLEMLSVKTEGNLSSDESQMLEKALNNLRKLYDSVEELEPELD